MIDEAMGKILGMAMAYGVSVLGLFLAYVNYRRRIVRAERVMTGRAWAVVAAAVLAVALGVLVVGRLAAPSDPAPETVAETVTEDDAETAGGELVIGAAPREGERSRSRWIGIVAPAGIFLCATLLTAALHRHFAAQPPSGS